MYLSIASTFSFKFFHVGSLHYALGYISLHFLGQGLPRAEGLSLYLHTSGVLTLTQTKIWRDLRVVL